MPQIGVEELKIRASEILRNVRQRKTRYIITYRGRPVGMLTPIEEPQTSSAKSARDNWDELSRLGRLIAAGWPAGITSSDVLSKLRR